MPSNKYQNKKAATQPQIYTPADQSKKSLNTTRKPAAPPPTLTTTTPIITETASDSKYKDPLQVKLAEQQQQIDKLIKRVNELEGKVVILDSQLAISEMPTTSLKRKLMT